MNFYLAKKVPVEFEHGSNTGEGAFAETDEEVELVDGEANIGSGRKLQHVDVTPPAQQGNVVGNVHRGNFNLQAIMLRHEMAMFELYMRRHLQAPYFPAAMPFSLPVNRKRPANVLPIEVAGETIAAMTGFIIGLHREKKRTRVRVGVFIQLFDNHNSIFPCCLHFGIYLTSTKKKSYEEISLRREIRKKKG